MKLKSEKKKTTAYNSTLSAGKGFRSPRAKDGSFNSTLSRGNGFKSQGAGFKKKPTSSLSANSSFKKKSYEEAVAAQKLKAEDTKKSPVKLKPTFKKSRGLTGHGKTADDIRIHGLIAGLGCFACQSLGVESVATLRVHHIQGRSKGKGGISEKQVICLCDFHHRPDATVFTDAERAVYDDSTPSVHGSKKTFSSLIGCEAYCCLESYTELDERPAWLSPAQWKEYISLELKDDRELFAKSTLQLKPASAA